MRGVASIIGQSLISLRNPWTGPERVGEKAEKFPLFPSTSFSSSHKMPWDLGKKAQKRPGFLPYQKCPSSTQSLGTGNQGNMELGSVRHASWVSYYLAWLWDPLRLQVEDRFERALEDAS